MTTRGSCSDSNAGSESEHGAEPETDADRLESPTIAVVGPGRMGQGIAQVFATHGYDVRLVDVKDREPDAVTVTFQDATAGIRSNLEFLEETGRLEQNPDEIVEAVTTTADPDAGLGDADWVFEALPENPDVKAGFLREHADLIGDAVVATTTSSISLDTLENAAPDPHKLLITHWLNPAFLIPLVEVAHNETTDQKAIDATVSLLEAVEKEPVVCRDNPGFIGSRVQAAAMNEAIRVYEEGVASPEAIDRALRTGVGFRMAAMGLIEFVDLGGVDVLYYVDEYLRDELGPRFGPPDSVVEKMADGDLGPETGRGYYDYEDVDVDALKDDRYERLLALLEAANE